VRASFDEVRRRVSASDGHTTLIVFFSGHSDGLALELSSERLAFGELKRFMEGTRADVRLLIVDSCRSGALLSKGGAPGAAFQLRLTADESSRGTVLLTSSAADEQALESKEIGGSFFTHHLVSGLRGAADSSGAGHVTLNEAYAYAYARTVRATADTSLGPQHPSFDYRLSGQGDLVLTELPARAAALFVPPRFERALAVDRRRDRVVAEATSAGARRLVLAPGDYLVRAWADGQPLEGAVHLDEGSELTLDAAALAPAAGRDTRGKGLELPGAPQTTTSAGADNRLTFDPVFLAVQTLSLQYERPLTTRWSALLKVRAGYLPHDSPMLKLLGGTGETSVLGGALGASFYPAGEALRGFFLGPGADLFRIGGQGTPALLFVASAELGYAWIWPSGFTLALAGGAQYGALVNGHLGDGDSQLGLLPRAGLRIGYAW
jgi:hypothetical protein